ncbi:DUF7345 domain-containing protein [Halorubrum laminariae]|uniref:DUF4897 domain-containing protein n=1 Tax=Halorubrum laminariae TaxID=1433523 RepID=A0ABD6C456_9EURY|nr:hypothetical protein [Halorubrum laminariae]
MQRTALILVVAVIFVALGVAATGGTAGASGDAAGASGVAPVGFEQTEVDPDDVLIEAAVDADGNATWEIQYRVRLATDEEEQAFADLQTDVDANTTTYTDRFRERMVATAAAAENATGREMAVTNVTVTAERRELPQSYGVLTYRFEWRNFAAVDGDRIVAGDAVDELFLDDGTSFIISWPESYRVVEATPAPAETRDVSIVWRGPTDFTAGEPRVSLEPAGVASGATLPLVGAVLAVLVLIGVSAGVARRRGLGLFGGAVLGRGDTDTSVGSADRDGSGVESGASATAGSDPSAPADAQPDSNAVSTVQDSPPADAADTDDTGSSDEAHDAAEAGDVAGASSVDEELLSNEEQVLRLIEANGGRMKQKRVAESLDWTAAKTSQVVTGLRDDNELDGFRLGRENVLSLPDFEAAGGGETADDDGPDDGPTGDGAADDDATNADGTGDDAADGT